MPPNAIPQKRILSPKENTLFKELLTLYETRQLKKGLKTADQILKKFPEHGETLCMKGLVLTHMGRREEGIDLVKKGVRLDLTSHICWHVFGLIQKGEKNYEEALKSYMQALRFDKENLNILRDAAQLQTQLRIYDGLVETRHTLLRLRPNLRQHWIALAVAYHLNGNLLEAKKVLEHYESSLKSIPDRDIEHSETLLYHVRLLEDLGEPAEALSLLDINAKSRAIIDRRVIMEYRARLLSKLKDEEAEHAWRALIEYNPECYDYYRGYLANKGIDLDAVPHDCREEGLAILQGLSNQVPRANVPKRLMLSLAKGDQFRDLIKPYVTSGLRKGVPSLFSDLKTLYIDPNKREIVEDVVNNFLSQCTPPPNTTDSSQSQPMVNGEQEEKSDPTIYLWTLYFLAQHYSYTPTTPSSSSPAPLDPSATSSLPDHARALDLLTKAIDHTPTLPEVYTLKARVLKRAGDLVGAVQCANEARLLDGQDRFLNTKYAKYLLRCGMVEEASDILGLFTKKDAVSPGADLEDMQSLFYLTEEGNAHRRNGKLNLSLKRYMSVNRIFNEIEDDQYDFHGYSLRKFTINIYLNLLKWEDQLRSHPAYITAALEASRIFIDVHDDPSLITQATSATGQLSEAAKKARKKAAKKAAQKKEEDQHKKVQSVTSNEDKGLEAPVKDDDPDGLKMLASSDCLEKAAKLLQPLSTLASQNITVWIAIYDVAVRRKKYLQAVKTLNHAVSLDPEHPELHVRRVDFRQRVSAFPQHPPPPIGPLITSTLPSILPKDLTLETFNSQYLQRHSHSPLAILATARVSHMLGSPVNEVEATVLMVLNDGIQLDIKTALSVLDFLKRIQSAQAETFRTRCQERFTLSTVFRTPAEQAELSKRLTSVDTVDSEMEKA